MRILFLLIAITFNSIIIYGEGKPKDDKIPGIPAISLPEAYTMAKYAEFPAADNFGSVQITLPIYTVNAEDLTHSIALNYNNSGIKVADEATWVGLGWDVNAGGAIIRSVRDLADDVKSEGNNYDVPTDYGWLDHPSLIQNCNTGTDLNKLVNHFWNLYYDLEPDIYYVHVGELNFKFIFGFDGKPKLIDCDKKVTISFTQASGGIGINKFEVTDDKGNVYTFGGTFKEVTTVTQRLYPTNSPTLSSFDITFLDNMIMSWRDIVKQFTTVWFLSSITSPNGNVISFDYEQKNGVLMDIALNKFQTNNPENNTPVVANTLNNIRSVNHSTNTWYLKDISFINGKLHFSTSDREDLRNGRKLDKIQLFDANSNVIHTYDFKYHYMNPTATYLQKRLVLESITNDASEVFSFNYYTGNLPAKNSEKQDFWGYFSNKSTSLIPTIYVYPDALPENRYRCYPISSYTNAYTITGSDRTVDESALLTGVLKTITYPTGGTTQYNFESNKFFDVLSNKNILGGGIRIGSLVKNPIIGNPVTRSINYDLPNGNSSGVLINNLAFATPTNYSFKEWQLSAYYKWEETSMSENDKYNWFTLRCANNFFPLTNLDGYQIGYTRVVINETGNGKTERLYYPPKNYLNNASMVNTSPVDAIVNETDSNSPQFITEGDLIWTKKCTKELDPKDYTKYIYKIEYKSPRSTVYRDCASCSSLDETEFHAYSKITYIGGRGYFFPYGYSPETFFPSDVDVFGSGLLLGSDFTVTKIDNFSNTLYCSKGEFSTDVLRSLSWNSILWGNIPQTGTNIFPYPPMSDNENDKLIYSKLKTENIYKEAETEPIETTDYEYKIYPADKEERVFGIFKAPHNVVSFGVRATAFDALASYGSLCKGAAYFFGNFYGNYAMPNAWAKYYYNVNTYALTSKVTKTQKFANSTVLTNTDYQYYDNLLTKKTTETHSDGAVSETQFKYPNNYVYSGITSIYSKMTDKNMLNYPVEELKLIDGKAISSMLISYKDASGLFLPEILYKLRSSTPLTMPTEGLSSASPNTNQALILSNNYKPDVYFDNYNLKGKLTQYHKSDNIYKSFIWGYNYQYPIAEIKNATYTDVENAAKSIFSVSSIDALSTLSTPNESKLKDGSLQRALPNASTTTYTYKPLVGMVTATTSRGTTTNYAYDICNRLFLARDNNNSIESLYRYGYLNVPDNGLGGYNTPTASINSSASIYLQDETGSVTCNVLGGSGNYTYNWYLKNNTDAVLINNLNTTSSSFSFPCSEIGKFTVMCIVYDNVTGISTTVSSGISCISVSATAPFALMDGYTRTYTILVRNGRTVTFVLAFSPTAFPIHVQQRCHVANVPDGFQPSAIRTISYNTDGRTWSITFDTDGSVYCKIVTGAILSIGSSVVLGTLTYDI